MGMTLILKKHIVLSFHWFVIYTVEQNHTLPVAFDATQHPVILVPGSPFFPVFHVFYYHVYSVKPPSEFHLTTFLTLNITALHHRFKRSPIFRIPCFRLLEIWLINWFDWQRWTFCCSVLCICQWEDLRIWTHLNPWMEEVLRLRVTAGIMPFNLFTIS